ncbi:MAG: S8 family serine peptidase [Candidatus Electronema sp. VV]
MIAFLALLRFDESESIKPILTVEEMTPSELARRSKDATVRGIAPKMPIKLISPLSATEFSTEDTESLVWSVSAVGADQSAFSGKGVIFSVLDTGIDRNHAAFSGVTLIEHDFSGDGSGDRQGHGTHCAGTIFGRAIAGKRIGVAPGFEKALIGKVLRDDGTEIPSCCSRG